jgi:hypothetical protein
MYPQQENSEKSLGRKVAEQQLKRQGKKLAKKLALKGAQLAKAAASKLIMILMKVLTWLVGAVGLPAIGIGLLIIVVAVVISISWAFLMGKGEGLSGVDKETYEYIVAQSNQTVDMGSEIEKPYRVPVELIAATIQLDIFQNKNNHKDIIKKMAKSLAPTFDYGQFNEWKETYNRVCEENDCTTDEITRTPKLVNKLELVEAWDGTTSYTYTAKVTNWSSATSYSTKTIQVPKKDGTGYEDKVITVSYTTYTRNRYYEVDKNFTSDYATFDAILNSYGLGLQDKRLVEINYSFMDKEIAYTEWLNLVGYGGDLGFIGFDGTIIPGGGVPAQFMPYYMEAEKKYNVHWYVLAALHFVETGFSTHPTMISSAGAIGHMQFLPATWVGWTYDIGGGRVSPSLDITSLAVISQGRGYGRDGNKDGKSDPFNVVDSIHTAAHYLNSNDYSTDPRKAIFMYNHAEWYVNKVLTNAERFKNAAIYEGGGEIPPLAPGSFMRPTVGPVTSAYGLRGDSMHFGIDIGRGGREGNIQIVAIADGIVTKSYKSSSYGNVVYIKHTINGHQYESLYAHMANRTVTAGQVVKQGQFLGVMGYTGQVIPSGPGGTHLHFEIHLSEWTQSKKNALNPALYVPL